MTMTINNSDRNSNNYANNSYEAGNTDSKLNDYYKKNSVASNYDASTDGLASEVYQATLGQPLSMRWDTWDKTFFGDDGAELNDHLGYTMWDKSWQEQDGWERSETVIDTVSGAATWAGIGMIAIGGLAMLTGIGAAPGAALASAGASSIGWGVGGKVVASAGIKRLGGLASKSQKARSFLNDKVFINSIADSADSNEIKSILTDTFVKNEEVAGTLSPKNIDELSKILVDEVDGDRVSSSLDFSLLNNFESSSKSLMNEIKVGNENYRMELAENAVVEVEAKKVFKNTPLADLEKEQAKIYKDYNVKADKITKDTTKLSDAAADLNNVKVDSDIGKIGSKYGDEDLILAYAKEKDIINSRTNAVLKESDKIFKLAKEVSSQTDMIKFEKAIKESTFLSETMKQSLLKEITVNSVKSVEQLRRFKERLTKARTVLRKEQSVRSAKSLQKQAERIATLRTRFNGHKLKIQNKVVNKLFSKSFKAMAKAKNLDNVEFDKFKKQKHKEFADGRASNIKKELKEEYRDELVGAAKKLTNNKALLKEIDRIATVEDAIKMQNKIETKLIEQLDKLFMKEQRFVASTKQKAFKSVMKVGGSFDKTMKWMSDKGGTLDIDVKHQLHKIEVLRKKYSSIIVENATPIELERAVNDIMKEVDVIKGKFMDDAYDTGLQKTIMESVAQVKADVINSSDYGHIREVFEGTGVINAFKRWAHDLGTNGNHYDALDKTTLEHSYLKQIFHAPQLEAKNAVDAQMYELRDTWDNIVNEYKLEGEDSEKMIFHALLRREGYSEGDTLKNRVWIVEGEKEWKVAEKLFKSYDIDTVKLDTVAKKEFGKYLDKQKVENPKDFEKFIKLSDEKKAIKGNEFKKNLMLDELHFAIENELKHSTANNIIGLNKLIRLSERMLGKAAKDELNTLKVFDPKAKVPARIDGWLGAIPLTRKKGVEVFSKNKDNSILDFHLGDNHDKVYQSTKNKSLHELSGRTNKDYELHFNPLAMVERSLHKSLSYSNFRKAEFEIKSVLNKTEGQLGKTFAENVKLEVFTNYNEGVIRQKNEVDILLDKLSRNAVYGILGFKVSTPIAQLTALPEFIATFRNPLDGIKAWTRGNAYLGSHGDDIDKFMKHYSGEYVERTDGIFKSSGSSAKAIIGSGEVNLGVSKYNSKTAKHYETFKTASMAGIKALDKAMYKGAFVGTYLHVLERNGVDVHSMNVFNLNNPELKKFVDEASQQVSEGMGSFSITNKSMFLKIGKLGKFGAEGGAQSWVRAFTLLQSFVYNSAFRMYNNGLVKPTKLWAMGKKGEAVQQMTSSIVMEMVGKMMYLENMERIKRMQGVLTGDGSSMSDAVMNIDNEESSYQEYGTPISRLKDEYLGHVPVVGSVINTFTFGDTAGIPSHIDGVLGASQLIFDKTFGEGDWGDMNTKDWKDFVKTGFIATGVPLNEPLDWAYKYDKNNTPVWEKNKLDERVAKKKVKEDNDNMIKWAVENPDDKMYRNGQEYSVGDVLKGMEKHEPKRYKKLIRQIKIKTVYGDMADEVEKVMKYTNINKAKFLVGQSKEDAVKWVGVLNDLGLYTDDLKKKIKAVQK